MFYNLFINSKCYALNVFFLAFLFSLPAYLMLDTGYFATMDFVHYSQILKFISDQLWQGDFLPKWFNEANGNLGSPVGIFYSPLSFYLASLLNFMSGVDPYGFIRVVAAINIFSVVAAVWTKKWLLVEGFTNKEARIGGVLYILSPNFILLFCYHVLPSFLAITLFPIILYYANKVMQDKAFAFIKFTIVYTALILTHQLAFIIFFPFLMGYMIYKWRDRVWIICKRLFLATMIAIMISAFYLLPFHGNLSFVNYGYFTQGKYSLKSNLLEVQPDIILTFMTVVFVLKGITKKQLHNLFFWYTTFFIVIFLTSRYSIYFWELFSFLNVLQFPGRILIILIPVSVYIILANNNTGEKLSSILNSWVVCMLLFSWSLNYIFIASQDAHAEKYGAHNKITLAPEYQTIWMKEEGLGYKEVVDKYANQSEVLFQSGEGKVISSSITARQINLYLDINSDHAEILLKRLYFPGWSVKSIKMDPDSITVNNKDGLVALKIPKGKYDVNLQWKAYGEKEGYIISIMGVCLLLCLAYLEYNKSYAKFPLSFKFSG